MKTALLVFLVPALLLAPMHDSVADTSSVDGAFILGLVLAGVDLAAIVATAEHAQTQPRPTEGIVAVAFGAVSFGTTMANAHEIPWLGAVGLVTAAVGLWSLDVAGRNEQDTSSASRVTVGPGIGRRDDALQLRLGFELRF
jgi:hypothetical protein